MSVFEFAEELNQPPCRFSNTGAMTAGRQASFRARRRRIICPRPGTCIGFVRPSCLRGRGHRG
jgi:hypothetical protein